MKVRVQRTTERPFEDKSLTRVCEYIDSNLTHAWLVRMADEGSTVDDRWNSPDEKPDWLSSPEPVSPTLHLS